MPEISETRELMGTFVTIRIAGDTGKINAAFSEIEKVNSMMSNYNPDSEVSALNREKEADGSKELRHVLSRALFYSELSDGAFDVTVQPILDLYKKSFEETGRPPSKEEIILELEKVGYEQIRLGDQKITLGGNGKITFGGIAKGYALDRAVEKLEELGVKRGLVNAGGDLRGFGNREWEVALANPRDEKDYITIVRFKNKAVATSGDYERYFDENKSFHHIVDPHTGYSATELISVTIIADKAIDADATATSAFVLGKEGLKMIESIEGVEGLLITRDREILRSSGFWEFE